MLGDAKVSLHSTHRARWCSQPFFCKQKYFIINFTNKNKRLTVRFFPRNKGNDICKYKSLAIPTFQC